MVNLKFTKNRSDKVLSYVVREFSELKHLLVLIESIEDKPDASKELVKGIKKALRKMRTGWFGSEERVVYRLASQYKKMKDAYYNSLIVLQNEDLSQLKKQLEEGDVYEKELLKLGARGGGIERSLYEARDKPIKQNVKKLKIIIQEAIEKDEALDAVVKNLISLFKKFKPLKGQLAQSLGYHELALQVCRKGRMTILILYNSGIVREIKEKIMDYRFLLLIGWIGTNWTPNMSPQERYAIAGTGRGNFSHGRDVKLFPQLKKKYSNYPFSALEAEWNKVKEYFDTKEIKKKYGILNNWCDHKHSLMNIFGVSDTSNEIYPDGYKIIEREGIVGYVELMNFGAAPKREKTLSSEDSWLGADNIYKIAAQEGFGPFLFELVFSWAALTHRPVKIDQEVSPAVRKAWAFFDTNRRDVIKYPSALNKYPELIGYTKQLAEQKFGKGMFSLTIGRHGYPKDTPREKLNEVDDSTVVNHYVNYGYDILWDIDREVPLSGEEASLMKVYYYDGRIKELKELLAMGRKEQEKIGELVNEGSAFFDISCRFRSGYDWGKG